LVTVPRARGRGLALVLDLRPILLVIGLLLVTLALSMLPAMIADLVTEQDGWQVFLMSAALTMFVGVGLILMNRSTMTTALTSRQAFLMTTSAWLAVAAFGAVPFYLADFGLSPGEAFFEATSGLTTTGATVMVGLDYAPRGILLWRATMQWLGGIGIIVMGVAVLPMLSVGGMQLFRAESSDTSEKILPRVAQIAAATSWIYLGLTFACGVLYWLAGMRAFDAMAHAMTSVATAGYSTYDASVGAFRSPVIEAIGVVFMIIGGMPFVLHIQFLRGDLRAHLRDGQAQWFLAVLALSSLVMAGWLHLAAGRPPLEALRLAVFNITSIVTTTGYASADYNAWGTFPVSLIFFLMCVGGCTGSTAGGIKIFRFIVLYATVRTQVLRLLQPHGVVTPTYNRRPLPETVSLSVMAFFFLFALSFAVVAVILSLLGLDYLTAMSSALSALACIGPGLGPIVGPAGSFMPLPETAKWVMSFAMLAGRLELFTVLILFSPAFWRT
jgi:trk system potassium uptake protein